MFLDTGHSRPVFKILKEGSSFPPYIWSAPALRYGYKMVVISGKGKKVELKRMEHRKYFWRFLAP
jgi:hypothetical protein